MSTSLPSVTCRQYGWLTVTTTSRPRATPAGRAIVDEYLAWMEPATTDAGMCPRFDEFVVASRLGRPIAVAGVRRGADDSRGGRADLRAARCPERGRVPSC